VLNRRERRIFEARRLAEKSITLEKLSKEFGVSRERVRQIEVRVFEKVEKAVLYRVAALDWPEDRGGCGSNDWSGQRRDTAPRRPAWSATASAPPRCAGQDAELPT
jgi:Sigma-70, region 4